jgi:phosphoribosylformylglycinamidine synthase
MTQILANPSVTSKRWIFEQYDTMVQTNTCLRPGAADAAVLRIKGSSICLAACTDGNSRFVYLDPQAGGRLAVAEAARNVACTGAKPRAITNCLNWGNPENPEVFWTFVRAVDGMAEACQALQTPVISGNVSLYNESPRGAIFPTPVVGMVGILGRDAHPMGCQFLAAGHTILLIDAQLQRRVAGLDGLGGSFYLSEVHGLEKGLPPTVDLAGEARLHGVLTKLAEQDFAVACHDVSDGGLAVALLEMSLATPHGFTIDVPLPLQRLDRTLFGEHAGWVLVACDAKYAGEIGALAELQSLACVAVGQVTAHKNQTTFWGQSVPLADWEAAYQQRLANLLS